MKHTFLTYNSKDYSNRAGGGDHSHSPSQNILIILSDPNDTEAEEPMQFIFEEALRIASRGNNVHWLRNKPALRIPQISDGILFKPNYLARIHLHYGYDALPSLIREFCSKTLFVNAITCSSLFVELQGSSWHFTNSECAGLLAQLCIAANWIGDRRPERERQEHFPAAVVLRDLPQYYQMTSLYSGNIIKWRDKQNWSDLLDHDHSLDRIQRKWVKMPLSI